MNPKSGGRRVASRSSAGPKGSVRDGRTNNGYTDRVAFLWSVADKLRGTYKQSEYGRVILPLVVLRRLDCVLEPTREQVRQTAARTEGQTPTLRHKMLTRAAGQTFYNVSRFDP